jgi:hypothetical protein
MVATPEVAARIERKLRAIAAEVDDLPNVEAEWETLPDWNQASIAIEWAHLMADYLTELDELNRDRSMSDDQQLRYCAMLHALAAAMPIIERLDLYRPPIPLEG